MAEEETSSTLTEGSSLPELYNPSKQVDTAKAMKSKVKPSHPTTADMVIEAILELGERNGSSLPAIKKFITNTWKLDVEKHAIYIKKYLRSAVANGSLIQTKGRGASGSFKVPSVKPKASVVKVVAEEPKPPKKPAPSKKTESAKADVTPTKKQAPSKKVVKKASPTVPKKMTAKKSVPTITEPKSSSKNKKVAKSPTSKPKAPKPKKVTATKSAKAASPKKVTAAKK